jgi:hypothetical protein
VNAYAMRRAISMHACFEARRDRPESRTYPEDALDPLHGRDDFRLLLTDLATSAEPFACPD